jgi:hypothetical protein
MGIASSAVVRTVGGLLVHWWSRLKECTGVSCQHGSLSQLTAWSCPRPARNGELHDSGQWWCA